MTPIDLPDGKPPLAREFSEAQMIRTIIRDCIEPEGGNLGIALIPEKPVRPGAVIDKPQPAHWLVSAEYGSEAPDSPMAGAAIYGTGATLRAALEQAGDDARLWRSDIKVAAEVEKEAHGG